MTFKIKNDNVNIIFDDRSYRISRKEVLKVVRDVLENENHSSAEVDIIFTNKATITKLNRKYFRKNQVTDVISFNFDDDLIGEIYICLPQARKQAGENSVPIKVEVKRLLVHGLLHLLGYNHELGDEDCEMFEKQESYLRMVN